MGRAVIVSNEGAGAYTVRQVVSQGRARARLAALQAKSAALDPKITEAARLQAEDVAAADYALGRLNTALEQVPIAQDALAAAQMALINIRFTGTAAEIAAAELAVQQAEALVAAVVHERKYWENEMQATLTRAMKSDGALQSLRLEKAGLESGIRTLANNLPGVISPTENAWCWDYTVDLEIGATVGTVDAGRLKGNEPLVIWSEGTNPSTRWGTLCATMDLTPEGAFYNLAMLPGVDRWRPRFRTARVTAAGVLANTLDVHVNPLNLTTTSPIRSWTLNCDQSTWLDGVPVEYMGLASPGDLFAVGDDVVIEFREGKKPVPGTPWPGGSGAPWLGGGDWSHPVCVGFAHDPKPCWPDVLYDGQQFLSTLEGPLTWSLEILAQFFWVDRGADSLNFEPFVGMKIGAWDGSYCQPGGPMHYSSRAANITAKITGDGSIGTISWPCWAISQISDSTALWPGATPTSVYTIKTRGDAQPTVRVKAVDVLGTEQTWDCYTPQPHYVVGTGRSVTLRDWTDHGQGSDPYPFHARQITWLSDPSPELFEALFPPSTWAGDVFATDGRPSGPWHFRGFLFGADVWPKERVITYSLHDIFVSEPIFR